MRHSKTKAVCFRLDPDLQPMVKKWLGHNPSLNVSRLANLAIRHFVIEEQTLKPIETIEANHSSVKTSLRRMIKKHKKTLDELK